MGKFGPGKAGTAKKFKERMEASASDITFIKNIPGDKILTVRFLEEPEEWYGYRETFDESKRVGYPVPEGMDLPEGQRSSMRYVANALDRDTDQVIPLKIPQSLASRLMMRFEKYDTLMDRDYDLFKTGKGLKTEYDLETGDREKIKLSKYELLDVEEVLEESYEWAMKKINADDDDGDSNPLKKSRKRTRDDDDDDDDEDDKPRKPKKKKKKKQSIPKDEQKFGEEEPEEDEDDDEDDEFYTEKQLKAMTVGELRGLCRDYGITFSRTHKKADLVEMVLEEAS